MLTESSLETINSNCKKYDARGLTKFRTVISVIWREKSGSLINFRCARKSISGVQKRTIFLIKTHHQQQNFTKNKTTYFNIIYGRPQDQMPAKLRLRDTLASIHQTRGAAFTWRPLQKMYGYKSLSPVLIFHQSEYCILAFFGKYWHILANIDYVLNWHEIDVWIQVTLTCFNLPP